MTGYYTTYTHLVAVLNIVGLAYFGENRIKIDYLIHILQWNGIHLKKIEIKQSILNLFCHYSTLPLIK